MTPKALTAQQAATYVGVSRSHFFAHIRQNIPRVNVSRSGATRMMWRWLPQDLDSYLMQRRIGAPHETVSP